jgi:hypothetical protein
MATCKHASRDFKKSPSDMIPSFNPLHLQIFFLEIPGELIAAPQTPARIFKTRLE